MSNNMGEDNVPGIGHTGHIKPAKSWKHKPTDYEPEASYRVINYTTQLSPYVPVQYFTAAGQYFYFDRFLEGGCSLYVRFGKDTNPWVKLNEGDCFHIKFTKFAIKSGWDFAGYGVFPLRARFYVSEEPFMVENTRARNGDGFNLDTMRSWTITTSATPNTPIPFWQAAGIANYATGMEYGGMLCIDNLSAVSLYISGRVKTGGNTCGIRISTVERLFLPVSGGNLSSVLIWSPNASAVSIWSISRTQWDTTHYTTYPPAYTGLNAGAEY